jgi:hypothetical protein
MKETSNILDFEDENIALSHIRNKEEILWQKQTKIIINL